MKPDLLITWIKHTDYPIFRAFVRKYRDRFGKVIIYFSEHNRFPYMDHFIHDAMWVDDVTWLDPIATDWGTEDWRNKSTNEMLKYSTSDWVCSIEQDYFCKDWPKMFDLIDHLSTKYVLFGHAAKPGSQPNQEYLKGEYIHPAFWFMKRSELEKTHKNFSADPSRGWDHFGFITEDAMKLELKVTTVQEQGLIGDVDKDSDCFHLGGVNQNYLNYTNPDYVFHRPEVFAIYNYWCRKVRVPQSEKFIRDSLKVEDILLKKFPGLNLEDNKYVKFFKA